MLFITGLMDTVCPLSIQFAAYNKVKAPQHMALYPDFHNAERYLGSSDQIYEFLMGF